jgi:hypothetical protein
MGVISVRIDDDTESMLSQMAKKRGVSKSEMVRFLMIRGLDHAPPLSEAGNEMQAALLKNSLMTEKNFKISAQILALTLRILKNINPDDIQEALVDQRTILEKNGVEA